MKGMQKVISCQLLSLLELCFTYSQLYSQSTAVCLKVYQRLKVQGFEDCTGGAKFTSLMNGPFNAFECEAAPLRFEKWIQGNSGRLLTTKFMVEIDTACPLCLLRSSNFPCLSFCRSFRSSLHLRTQQKRIAFTEEWSCLRRK